LSIKTTPPAPTTARAERQHYIIQEDTTMTKAQQQTIIDKMKETIGFIRDAEKNADYFFTADEIRSNMGTTSPG
jgi:hypothetical protein